MNFHVTYDYPEIDIESLKANIESLKRLLNERIVRYGDASNPAKHAAGPK